MKNVTEKSKCEYGDNGKGLRLMVVLCKTWEPARGRTYSVSYCKRNLTLSLWGISLFKKKTSSHYSYLRVKKASGLVYDCSNKNVTYTSPHFGHRQKDSRQWRMANVDKSEKRDNEKKCSGMQICIQQDGLWKRRPVIRNSDQDGNF